MVVVVVVALHGLCIVWHTVTHQLLSHAMLMITSMFSTPRPAVLLVGNVTVDVVDGKNVAVWFWWGTMCAHAEYVWNTRPSQHRVVQSHMLRSLQLHMACKHAS